MEAALGRMPPDGRLRFNWRLIMLPPEIIDYVVVHELAHLRVPGHNPRFWGQVAAILPDYRGGANGSTAMARRSFGGSRDTGQ